jgi:hypothetical protein
MKALAELLEELDGTETMGGAAGVRGLMVKVAGPHRGATLARGDHVAAGISMP